LPKSFKKLYSFEWKISAQKESFVKVLLESWGLRVRAVGIGTLNDRYLNDFISEPDFEVYYENDLIAYIEVTGANLKINKHDNLWIAVHKIDKYNILLLNRPVYIVYMGFNRNRLMFIKYLGLNEVKKFEKNIIIKKIRGRCEKYIAIPYSRWHPIKELYREFLQVIR